MSKQNKKVSKLIGDIAHLEAKIQSSLGKKVHNTAEINLPKIMQEIAAKRAELKNLTQDNT